MRQRIRFCVSGLIVALLVGGPVAFGQSPSGKVDSTPSPKINSPKKAAARTTFVEFELLQSSESSALLAQHWLKALEPLDVKIRIHRATADSKPELKEHELGTLRYVTAIGAIDRSGNLVFPNKTFNVGENVRLKEWVEELRAHGVQGDSSGKPMWGLTPEQFEVIYDAITKPVEFETSGLSLKDMTGKLAIPEQFPLKWSADAQAHFARIKGDVKVQQQLQGFSIATALAVALNDADLGFRPHRLPAGTIELLIEPRDAKRDQWPIGWPLKAQRIKAAPKFYALVPIEVTDVELSEVIIAVSKVADIPILINYRELAVQQIDLEKTKVNYPRKSTNWSIALSRIIFPHRLTHEIWQDEQGRPFVWITSTRAARAKNQDADKTGQ